MVNNKKRNKADMRVQAEEWRKFIPGVRMYKGKMTYFYNGEILYHISNLHLIYSEEERLEWEVIIVLPGVEFIPEDNFNNCEVKTVIMSDSVKRIEHDAFRECDCLEFVRLSKNIEYIGNGAFSDCESLHSIFIPESCREIGNQAFESCKSLTSIFIPESCRKIGDQAFIRCEKLIILTVPRNTTLGNNLIESTALIEASHFETDEHGHYDRDWVNLATKNDEVNEWIKNLNQAEEFSLHRECASIEPSEISIYEIIKHHGPSSLHVKNQIGVTPLEYLDKNSYTDIEIDQHKLMKRLLFDMMGEIIA